jgi:hypothetical protein
MRLVVSVFLVLALVAFTTGCIGVVTSMCAYPGMRTHQQDAGFGSFDMSNWSGVGFYPESYNCHYTRSYDFKDAPLGTWEPSPANPITIVSFSCISDPVPAWAQSYSYYSWWSRRWYTYSYPGYTWGDGHFGGEIIPDGHWFKKGIVESELAYSFNPAIFDLWYYRWNYGPMNPSFIRHGTGPNADVYHVNTCVDAMPGIQFLGAGQCMYDSWAAQAANWMAQSGRPYPSQVATAVTAPGYEADSHDLCLQDATGREISSMDELFSKLVSSKLNAPGSDMDLQVKAVSIPGVSAIALENPLNVTVDTGLHHFGIDPAQNVAAYEELNEKLKASGLQPGDSFALGGVKVDFGSFSATLPNAYEIAVDWDQNVMDDMVTKIRQQFGGQMQAERNRIRAR